MMILYGGNGFIGRHLAAAAEDRCPVAIVSRKKDDAFLLRQAPSALFMHPEEFFGPDGERLVRRSSAFLYLASTSIPASNAATPWLELPENVVPAFSTLNWVAEANPGIRILFPSSGGTVYGEGDGAPFHEASPLRPISAYGLAKVMAEQAVAFVGRKTGADFAILRISNPVGIWHGSRGQGLVEVALRKAMTGEPLTVFGDGTSVRDYFDADDLADALIRIGTAPGRLGGVWNLGSGRGLEVNEIVELVSAAAQRRLEVSFTPKRLTDVRYSVLDVSEARARFGWEARTPIAETVAKVYRSLAGDQE